MNDLNKELINTINWSPEKLTLKIGNNIFKISSKFPPISGTKKTAYLLENETQFIKVIKTDNPDSDSIFRAMDQTFLGQIFLSDYGIPFPKIIEFDPEGPPFRYFIQNAISNGSISAVELIKTQNLNEVDVKQMSEYINKFELDKKWQLDTNPFNWYRANLNDESEMVYIDGKVYPYEENWAFKNVGLLQWTDPRYIERGSNKSAKIPTDNQSSEFAKLWHKSNNKQFDFWKKYLDPSLQP